MEAQLEHPRRERLALGGVAVIAACIAGFYLLVGTTVQRPFAFKKADSNYYPLLVDGFRAGHLGLAADPPAGLAKLSNPYDPAQREQAGLVDMHDVSYFHGRYYLYFGVAPAVTLFWPFRAFTGVHFSQELATILFCIGGYFCSLGLFLGFRRRYFPDTAPGWIWLGALMIGTGNLCPAMLARNSVWEVPIAAAYFYSCLGLLLFFRASIPGARRGVWLALAGLALGLSIASRPHFVFLCVMLGLFRLWDWRRRGRAGVAAGLMIRETVALFLPVALLVSGLLAYNYARFGDPLEFGVRYQLGGIDTLHLKPMSIRFLPLNFYYYFLAPAQFQRYFPFVTVIRGHLGSRPAGYLGIEDPYGVLANLPCFWLALLAPVIWARRGRGQGELGRWMALLALCFSGVAVLTLCFGAANNRYMVDFLPLLLLVAALALLMLSRRGSLSAGAWLALRILVAAGVIYSAAFSALAAINHEGRFAVNEPGTYRALARFFDRPVLAWEKLHPGTYGPAEVSLRFPMGRPGNAEPILVTGASYASDYLYAVYATDGRHLQLGFSHTNHNQEVSQPIAVDYRTPHTLGIQMGSLYPAATHPYFSAWDPGAIEAAKHTLVVTLDGVPYLFRKQDFYDTTPGFVTFGDNDVSEFVARRFSGQILSVARKPLEPPVHALAGNQFARLALVLPADGAGRREPLIGTGISGASDLLFIEYKNADQVRFGLEHAGRPSEYSRTFPAPKGEIHLLEASLGSFYDAPRNARESELAGTLFVRWNGQLAWVEKRAFYPGGASPPTIGFNRLGNPEVAPEFTGRIVAQDSLQLLPIPQASAFHFAPYWIEAGTHPAYGPVRMRFQLPDQVTTSADPLLVTGPCTSQEDFLLITYPYPGQIGFSYLQPGAGSQLSRHYPAKPGSSHTVEIDMPSLYPTETDAFFATRTLDEIMALRQGWLSTKLDGTVVFKSVVPHSESTADQVTPGENRVSDVCGPRFTGKILSVERSSFEPPPGFDANDGPIEIVLIPIAGAKGTENLLSTGPDASPDTLAMTYGTPDTCRLSVNTTDGRSIMSAPVRIEADTPHILLIRWGGLYADASLRRNVTVALDGKRVLAGQMKFGFSAPQRISLGTAARKGAAFSGILRSVRRLPSTTDLP